MWNKLYLPGCLIAAIVAAGIFIGMAGPAEKPEGGEVRGTPWRGKPGITESVAQIMERQSRRRAPDQNTEEEPERHRPKRSRQPNPDSPAVSRWPPQQPDTAFSPEPLSFHSVGTNFKAVTFAEAPHDPPDTIGAVGPTQILVVVNARVRVFSRNGEVGPLDVSLNDFFASVNGGVTTWDPQVKYDRLSGRFFLTALNDGVPNHVLIAVSSGPVIAGSTNFTFFRFRNDEVTPTGPPDSWADYDGLGVDRLSLYIGVDVGNVPPGGEFFGTDGFVVNKADLLNGVLTVTVFRGMYPGGQGHSGPDDPRGVSNDDPNATEGYFIGPDFKQFGRLILRRVTYPGGVPTISSNISLMVPQTNLPLDVPHAGMLFQNPVDPEDDRLFTASIHTNKITGVRSLWTAHNIQVDASGIASDFGFRDGSRWYEIGNLSSNPTLIQSGTVFDPTVPWYAHYFVIPSIAMSGQGHATLGFTTAGEIFHLDAGAVGRLSGDPPGTMRPFNLLTSSNTSYNHYHFTVVQPWGDYSATLVDPNDDMTFWTIQEYCDAIDSWAVRVVELKAPPPATPVSAAPASLCSGVPSVQVTVSGNVVSGSSFFDPGPDTGGPGFANHIAASVTGGVSVISVLFDSPTQVRLNLSTTGASAGGQDISITNPDGQSMTGTDLLTIMPQPPTPSVSNNGPICAGGTLQLTASTIPGATYLWSGPNGFTSTVQNPMIPSVSGAASGSYTLAVTVGVCSSAQAITPVTVLAGGAACNDGNTCTLGETCQTGMCLGGTPRDTDLDAHVDAACGGSDCNDSNPLVWSAPEEVANLALATIPTDLVWDDQGALVGPETIYDLVSGPLSAVAGIDFAASACLQSGTGTSYPDVRPDPPPGQGFWFLARARNSCGIGTYGSSQRDSDVLPCP